MLAPQSKLEITRFAKHRADTARHFYLPLHGYLRLLLTSVVASSGCSDAGEAGIWHGSDLRLCAGFGRRQ
jgi:hypothetical protein